jgi:hypothetical protein
MVPRTSANCPVTVNSLTKKSRLRVLNATREAAGSICQVAGIVAGEASFLNVVLIVVLLYLAELGYAPLMKRMSKSADRSRNALRS